jgi:hypothetical protein
VIDGRGLVAAGGRIAEPLDVVAWLEPHRPRIVAVDSPRRPAPPGQRSRDDERDLVAAGVCGIRYTPDPRALAGNLAYYAWIFRGFTLYDALSAAEPSPRWRVIECFPTATRSRLGGPRANRTRAAWSQAVLESLGLELKLTDAEFEALG